MKNSHKSLFLLLAIFLLIRFPLIYFPLDLNVYESQFPSSQRFIGAFALDLIHGLRLPIWDYFKDIYAGGNLVIAAWTVPFILFLGPNLFAVKLASLCWHLIALVLWYFVFRKHYSEGKTFFILLFIVLAPPQITNMFLLNDGIHMDTILWMALSLLIFQRFLDGKLSEKKAGLILGFLGGFSSWTVLTNLITVAVIWIYLAFLRETRIRKSVFFLFYLPSFLMGVSPLIYYNHLGKWYLFVNFLEWTLIDPNNLLESSLYYGMWLVRHTLRVLLSIPFSSHVLRYFFRDGYALLYLFSLFVLGWKKSRVFNYLKGGLDLQIFGLLFQFVFIPLLIWRADLEGTRFFLPLVPFMGMTIVVAGELLTAKRRQLYKILYKMGLILVCLVGSLGGYWRILKTRYPEPSSTFSMRGHNYTLIHNRLEANFYQDHALQREKLKQFVKKLPSPDQAQLYREMDFYTYGLSIPGDLPEVLVFIHEANEEFYPIMYEKLGHELVQSYAQHGYENFILFLENSNISKEFYPYIFRGLILELGEEEQRRLCSLVLEESKSSCYEGLGIAEGMSLWQSLSPIPAWVEPNHVHDYLRGVGQQASFDSILEGEKIRPFVYTLDDSRREAFFKGFADAISQEEDPYREWKMRQRFQELSVP